MILGLLLFLFGLLPVVVLGLLLIRFGLLAVGLGLLFLILAVEALLVAVH